MPKKSAKPVVKETEQLELTPEQLGVQQEAGLPTNWIRWAQLLRMLLDAMIATGSAPVNAIRGMQQALAEVENKRDTTSSAAQKDAAAAETPEGESESEEDESEDTEEDSGEKSEE